MRDPKGNVIRFQDARGGWTRSFALSSIKCLIVCRGPVRKEAMEVFDAIGIAEYGILLSEKDSVVYPRCVAPELRGFRFPDNVHRVPDYMGVGQEEKQQRIAEIIEIAVSGGYTHIFAGYGFMAEDADFVEAIEASGVTFMGPSSSVARRAGAKDESKKLARSLGASVVPGIDDISAQALLDKAPDRKALEKLAAGNGLEWAWDDAIDAASNAEALLQAGYEARKDLVSVAELQAKAESVCAGIWKDNPGRRIRFKHIGGGGGKGQRVVDSPGAVASAVMDVLAESKVTATGSNRNFLIELNIETGRHNEIQLIGNGQWCVSLGGRDCSVQMHDQKLLEISLTKELLEAEIAGSSGRRAEVLRQDAATLEAMEADGAAFGEAVGLNSVSTFECLVDGSSHYFMEVNTRIQVEHRVTELAYELKFTNPDDFSEYFIVESLVEAMALLSLHGDRLPRPERVVRHLSGAEVRVNATNEALQPHAGGLIQWWSPPSPGEIRDDQGIGVPNPDTGSFIYYTVAGAYDSNIALVITHGDGRRDNLERLARVLARTEMHGQDLQTNLLVHYGLTSWLIGNDAMAKPSTRFMGSWLAAVGALELVARDVDLDQAWKSVVAAAPGMREVLAKKVTLLRRPLERLLSNAHVLAGFLGRFDGELWRRGAHGVELATDPAEFLWQLYVYLGMEPDSARSACQQIWDHDAALVQEGRAFYTEVAERTGLVEWSELDSLLAGEDDRGIAGGDAELWARCRGAHRGHMAGVDLLLMIARIGVEAGFFDVTVGEDLEVRFPERFLEAESVRELTRVLVPPPVAASDEIVAPMSGHYYPREAPHLSPLMAPGDRFEKGQPLFVIEVMKMSNKILAPFSGRVVSLLMDHREGQLVNKGEAVFRIEPDEKIEIESPETIAARRKDLTARLLG